MSATLLASGAAAPLHAQEILAGDDEVEIAYWRVEADATDRLVIAVHGGPGLSHGYLRPELDAYTEWGALVYYDQRGCGESGHAAHLGWEEHVADLHRLISALRGERSVVLVGSSFGSILIYLYLSLHADVVEGVVLSGMESSDNAVPQELAARLNTCPEVNRATIESMTGLSWPYTAIDEVWSLTFDDSGRGGAADSRARRYGKRWRMSLPSHDPWFTHPQAYFAAVGRFIAFLESADSTASSEALPDR